MKSIKEEKDLNNKRILLRLDLNVPIENRKITDTKRIDKILDQIDDITFLDPNTFKTNLDRFMKSGIDWDVCIVGGNNGPPFVRMDDFCIRTFNCQTTTGYIVKKRFYDVLIENFHNSATNLIKEPEQRRLYAIDVYWKRLQAGGTWYMITPVTVIQKEGYSDIEKKNMNYTPLMMDLEKKWLQSRINPVTH